MTELEGDCGEWVPEPEPKPVTPELEPGYGHADYVPKPDFTERMAGYTILDRLNDDTTKKLLMALAHGGIGDV